jgi:hypothetical protein
LPDEELTEQLNRLRARAGNPSVRELARLTERQGPRRAMTRSTVQDKISGKSPPRLGQILALVQACADYANSIGAPLGPEDTDEQVWRERVHAMSVRTRPPSPAPTDAPLSPPARWDLDPLIRVGMYDMVDLMQANEHQPMANWLPTLIQALGSAGMSNEQFLKAASRERPPEVVASILALAASQEEIAVERLIYLCAANQPAEHIPAIIALLRRKGGASVGVRLADLLIERLAGQSNIGPAHYVSIVSALRSATMERDATQVLKGIGKRGDADLILELAASFPDRLSGDRETILSSVAEGSSYHLRSLLKALQTTTPAGIDPKRTLDRIIFGIPLGKNQLIASDLESDGMHEEAQRVLELEGEPPF